MAERLRLVNDNFARALHQRLYERMISFCQQYTPEFPSEPIVEAWLKRLYSGDNNLHILVNFDNQYNIIGHAIIDIQEQYGYKIVYCYQAQADKGTASTLDEGIEYVEKLRAQIGAYCSVFMVAKYSKALEKKYGYKAIRTVMIKYYGEQSENNV